MSITLYNQYIYKNGEWKLVGTSIDPPTKTSDLTNDSGFITAADIPVESVNGETGAVVLDAADVGAQPTITANGILKANGSGTVTAATAGTDYQAPLPSQSGNSGKYLTTNGTAMSWGDVDALPSQTGNSGKFLTTDGTDASWTSITQDDHKWGNATLDRTQEGIANDTYVPQFDSTSDTTAKLAIATKTPANYAVAKYDGSAYLHSTTPTSSDNSTKVATTAYVDTAVGAITYPVTSVNTKTGAVSLTASDVGALPDDTTIPQGTVTSVRVQATSPVQSSTNTAQSTTLNTTISLADSYGDTKNPYAAKAKNTVLAGPSTGTATAPSFRTLEADDIPSLTVSKISDFPSTMTPSSHTHGNITNAGDITTTATIASGDRLVINDESASKITNSSITFGTSETTYLTNKGTWKTPDYPVTSVNTKTGAVSLTASDVGALPDTTEVPTATSDLTNDSGFITSSDIPVTSVNTKTGAVSLSASDVSALPDSTDVTKWNDVSLTKTSSSGYSGYVPYLTSTTSTSAMLRAMSATPSSGRIAVYNSNNYLTSTTPSASDNSTKVATTEYVDSAINELGSLLTFKGVVATTGDLPGSGNDVGDVWVVSEDNSEHVWIGEAWERLGTTVDLSGYVPTSRTVNNKALSTNITLTASDVNALPDTTSIPSATSDLTNDSGFITANDIPQEIFIAEYGTETFANIRAAHVAGKIVFTINDAKIFRLVYCTTTSIVFVRNTGSPSVEVVTVSTADEWASEYINAQSEITASGILKGDGAGGVTAAVAGTDYQAPISNNVTGSGTSGYLAKFNGKNTVTSGPALGSATTTYLRNDGSWATPAGTYSLPAMTTGALGGAKLYSATAQTVAPNAVTATASRTYAVQLNSSQQAVVNVPWSNTTTGTTYAAASVPNNTTFATQGSVYNVYNATKHTTLTVTLAVASWNTSTKQISVTASGVTASNLVEVSPAPASWEVAAAAGVYCSAQAANSLTFKCSSIPSAAITVNVVIFS